MSGVIRIFHENNAFFLGRFGKHAVVLCMCSMGGSGRDSAQIVTGEVLRFWRPSALILVGVAFGRDTERQKIGDVLVSEQIIPYEPERVGSESTVPRGQALLPGVRLYNSFRNADIDWCFRNPNGLLCAPHFGPILSGQKLIDNSDFKSCFFEKHPNAIGGEMEGVGVATCAEREKCEWILVKAICDWADGKKTDDHHGFAAASAVSFICHVLSQPGAVQD
jgi:nucleoside phosphorylase